MANIEPWLRGPVEGIPSTLQPAAHAFIMAVEDTAQKAVLAAERDLDTTRPPLEQRLAGWRAAVHRAMTHLAVTPENSLMDARLVGRAKLPSTVLGLIFHAAEHASRHTGQIVATAKIVRSTLLIVAAAICLGLIAAPLQAQTQDHQYTAADINAGSRLYATQCQQCHGQMGDQISGINLRRGQFRRVASDDDLRRVITVGVTESGMPPFTFQPRELDTLVAFIRAGFDPDGTAVRIGDAQRGKTVFENKGQCLSCHRVNGIGSRIAPDLSDIGSARQPAAIHRSLIEPTRGMWPINRPVQIVTRDGRTIRGRRLNEDTFTIQLIDEREQLVSIDKSQVQQYDKGTSSSMPSVVGVLTGDEIADVVSYLLSLKGS